MPHISIKAETVFNVFGLSITNSFLSTLVVFSLVAGLCIVFYKQRNSFKSGYVFFIKFIMNALYNLLLPILKEKTDKIFPVLVTFFLFILISNWFGLLPGVGSILIKPVESPSVETHVETSELDMHAENNEHSKIPLLRAATADLNTTFALALVSIFLVQFYGFLYLGKGYLKKFFNFAHPVMFALGLLEIVSEFSKILSFSFRLFGNIFAGEVLLSIVAFLVPVLGSFPFLLLELFVGIVQALVFTMLTAVFINSATIEHH